MAKLVITADQEAVITAIDTPMDEAFKEGVEDTFANPVIDPLPYYADPTIITPTIKDEVKNPFKSEVAATMKVLNIKRALPAGITAIVILAPISTGFGYLIFIDGLLVSYLQPT